MKSSAMIWAGTIETSDFSFIKDDPVFRVHRMMETLVTSLMNDSHQV